MHIYFIDAEPSVSSSKKEETVSPSLLPVDSAHLSQKEKKVAQPLLPMDTAQSAKKEKIARVKAEKKPIVKSNANARIDPNSG